MLQAMAAGNSNMANSPVFQFLRQRGVAEESLTRMLEDRIDATVISQMDDTRLAVYLPAYGDRLAARRFCLETEKDQAHKAQENIPFLRH